ncbi:hypothetical protein RJ640_007190 [Escallonia rubra]|uniref:Uncharacterized protein n=1 Tax=Escallonia rubra TaxID=112253 RepID=A0AA88QUS4_9ASTE|nr:hypothetical protein RJ640_007190 [Escallonia rubra]
MGRSRRQVLVGLALVMLLGLAVYFRLWTIDYRISSDEAELIRRQFDLANREAMDESAEWRLKYDEEVEKATKCAKELIEVKAFQKKSEDAGSITKKLEMLQKENIGLLEQLEIFKQELEAERLKCSMQRNRVHT